MPDAARLRRLTYVVNVRLPTEKAHGLQTVRMCEAFARLGVSTTLVHPARRQPPSLAAVDPLVFYAVRHRFAVVTRPNLDVVPLERWLPRRAFTAAHFLHARLWARAAVRYAVRAATADLFVARDVPVAASLVARGRPTVLEVHDVPARRSLTLLRRVAAAPALRALVAMTGALRDTLATRGVDTGRVVVLHDGVDLDWYAAERPTRAAAAPLVRYTGQLFPEKGVGVLVHAARLLPDRVRVSIVGGMPDAVEAWRRRLRADGPANVVCAGYVPPDRVPALQQQADVLVLPNSGRHPHSARYSSPLKAFEYMAAGRPIVASDVPALREVLRHDVNAWLVRPDDPTALAEGIGRVLDDPALGSRLATRAAADVRAYAWTARAAALAHAAGFTVPDAAEASC